VAIVTGDYVTLVFWVIVALVVYGWLRIIYDED
jgi:hypothetical protein